MQGNLTTTPIPALFAQNKLYEFKQRGNFIDLFKKFRKVIDVGSAECLGGKTLELQNDQNNREALV